MTHMSDEASNNRALLPAGLRDLLPPDAETEASWRCLPRMATSG
jgi:hypothetical protein